MKRGGKITRKSWLKYDYLYIFEGILYCDGGFPFIHLKRITVGNWLKYKERINAK